MLRRIVLSIALASVVGAAWLAHPHPRQRLPLPEPADEVGEEHEFDQRRQDWIEHMHQHAAGTDWRARDAATRELLYAQRGARLASVRHGAASAMPAGAPPGIWRERGARNVAGRVSDVDYDSATDQLTAFAHGGQLWRSQHATLDWQPLNDARAFEPQQNAQHFQRIAGSPERLLAADDTQRKMFYSDDQGASWVAASGFAPPFIWNWMRYLVARDPTSNQVYALIFGLNTQTGMFEDKLVASNDRGATYTTLGPAGTYAGGAHLQNEQDALFGLGQGSSAVYLLAGTRFVRIETNGTPTHVSDIAGTPAGFQTVALTGGIDAGSGNRFFYAFFEDPAGGTAVFRSLDGGATWQPRGTAPTQHYIRVAAGASLMDPNQVFYGGVDLYRSQDGGMSFTAVNDWPDYYGDNADKLHADISFVKTFFTSDGHEVELVGTDGGLYESSDNLHTVRNLSLEGMRQAQYYGSYTGRAPPYATSIGSQDQGYQFASAPNSGVAAFTQLVSGDYGSLTSSNDGISVWMNYPSFTQLSNAANTATPLVSGWDFHSIGFGGAFFIAPLQADPANPLSAWIGGGATTSGHNHVLRLVSDPNTLIVTPTEGSFEFEGPIEALTASASAPSTWYAMSLSVSNGINFYRSTTPLSDWVVADRDFAPLFFGNMILPDPVLPGTLYVCGSGYDGPSVYVSIDNGNSFTPMDTGLPSTMVYALAMSPDGQHLFAATEVGPFYFDRAAAAWVDLGAGAPDSTYWNVEFIPALHVAKFATFGRGLWDFDLGGGDLIFRDGYE